ncbi:hypothetical protein M8J77_002434 [Diaphorina citri]|nr:hypothetical protein M8J77_002434 [Diaphorina citri]
MVYEFLTNFPSVNYDTKSDLINANCRHDLNRLSVESKQLHLWALKMLDASSKPGGSGILNGNINYLGSLNQCVNVGIESSTANSNVTGNYCIATLYVEPEQEVLANETVRHLFDLVFAYHSSKSSYHKLESPYMVSTTSISRGLCVPGSCDYQDVLHLLETSLQEYNSSGLTTRVHVDEHSCYKKQDLVEMDASNRIHTFVTLGVFTSIIIIATLIDSSYRGKIKGEAVDKVREPPKSILLAFSLYRTWPQLWDTSLQPGEITCVHGVRFLAVIFIYVQHKLFFGMFNMICNRTDMLVGTFEESMAPLRSLNMGIDVLVFISGCLTSYHATQKLAAHGKLDYMKMYVTRYIKITPMVTVICWLFRNLNVHMTGAYFRISNAFIRSCRDNSKFLRNVFHVQNTLIVEEMCYPVTHSLATDMQHYLVAPIILTLLWKLRRNTLTLGLLLGVSLLGLTLYKGYVVYTYNMSTFSYFGYEVKDCLDSMNNFHIGPIHQFTTYLLGLVLGAILQSGKRIILTPFQKLIGWLLVTCCVYYTCYRLSHVLLLGYKYNVIEHTEYTIVRPLVWSFALAYLIYMCHTGQAETLNRLLSWRYLVVFSRLSYAIYLTSVFSMVIIWSSMENSTPINSTFGALIDLNELGITFISSVYFTLLLLMPLKDLVPLILGVKETNRKNE